ncbi:MAG: DUF433 domain-containing protein [Planctomycetota bacterium]
MKANGVSIDSEVMHGAPVFRDTRVPVEALFDYFHEGATVDKFIKDFPSVQKADVLDFLDSLKKEYSFEENRVAGREHSSAIKASVKKSHSNNGTRNGLGEGKKRKAS